MKRLALLTNESLIFGVHKTGIADVVDGIATSVQDLYSVVIILYSNETANLKMYYNNLELFQAKTLEELHTFFNQNYFDIVHNFAQAELINIIPKQALKIYTIDQKKFVLDKVQYLEDYDIITTVSKEYSSLLLKEENELGDFLRRKGLYGITNGISSDFFNPQNHLFMDLTYDCDSLERKGIYKERFIGIDKRPLFLFAGRIVQDKGIQSIIQCLEIFQDCYFIVYGAGDPVLTGQLNNYKKNNLLFINEPLNKQKTLSLLAAADYFLLPSVEEPCGLMPMLASVFGAIPIVSSVGGLKDNFNQENSIVINNNLQEAIDRAEKLYKSETFRMFQQKVMKEDRSWKVRIQPYIELYNKKDLN